TSPVVEDITAGQQAGADARRGKRGATPPERPEEVTDVLAAIPAEKAEKSGDGRWPTTEKAGRPRREEIDGETDQPGSPGKGALSRGRGGKGRPKAEPKAVPAAPASRAATAKQRRNRRFRTLGRSMAAMFAVLALLTTGGGWSYLQSTGDSFTQVSALDGNSEDVVDGDLQLGDENYLIVGTDTRAGANGAMGAGTLEDAEGARADTVMLVHIPKDRRRVVAVSFPRDLDVTRPQCNRWDNDAADYTDEVFEPAMGDKLNAVYALGGPRCLVNVVRKMSGLNIGHFIGIDFAGFEAMVDTIGGVEVCVNGPLEDTILGTVLAQGGKQVVDGHTALNFVRARHVIGEERSDYDRINRQQRFMASLLRGALSSNVLLDPGKLNNFINAFTKHTFVDNVKPEDLLRLGRSLQKVDAGAVTFLTIPTAGTTDYGNEIPREQDIKAIFSAIRDDRPLPGEQTPAEPEPQEPAAPPAPPEYTAVDPETISLMVSNGSGYSGLAAAAANRFSNEGFGIYNVANYQLGTSSVTKVRFASGYEDEAATVASAVPGASLEIDEDLGGVVEIVIGMDSATGLVVQSPTETGSPITGLPPVGVSTQPPLELPEDLEHINAAGELCA
ncbi:LCP family protein, partial [Nocardia farcinica]|uniref:LCP family protein n=2 Tax=Nocardia TaxID=1817 RepID=UPI0024574BC1